MYVRLPRRSVSQPGYQTEYFLLKRENEPFSSLQDGGGFLILMAGWDQRGPGGRSGEGDGGDRRFALPCAVLGAEGQSLQVLSQRQRRSRGSTEPPSPSHRPRGGTSPRLGLRRQVPSPRLGSAGFLGSPSDIPRLMVQLVDFRFLSPARSPAGALGLRTRLRTVLVFPEVAALAGN